MVFFNFFIAWWNPVLITAAFLVIAFRYFGARMFSSRLIETRWKALLTIPFKKLFIVTVCIRVGYAALLTWGQYRLWESDPLGRLFLNTSLDSAIPIPFVRALPLLFDNRFGYFLFSSWFRFWLSALLAVFVGYLLYRFFRILERYQPRFFYDGEPLLGGALAVLVGWPGVIVYIPLIFMVIAPIALIRRIIFKDEYTAMGIPFIVAGALALIAGHWIIAVLGLDVFRVCALC